MTTGLLLIAHGSRRPEANNDLHLIADSLRSLGEFHVVEPCFLELAEPDIATGGAHCVNQGAERIVMLPYFLSAGVHVIRDLKAAQAALRQAHETVEIVLAEPIGLHPAMIGILADRASEAVAQPPEP